MFAIFALATSLAKWQGGAGRLFTQTHRSIYITEFFVCVMCLTAQGRCLDQSLWQTQPRFRLLANFGLPLFYVKLNRKIDTIIRHFPDRIL